MMFSPWAATQAMDSCAGVTPFFSAILVSAVTSCAAVRRAKDTAQTPHLEVVLKVGLGVARVSGGATVALDILEALPASAQDAATDLCGDGT